jgi:hypothetical protein
MRVWTIYYKLVRNREGVQLEDFSQTYWLATLEFSNRTAFSADFFSGGK